MDLAGTGYQVPTDALIKAHKPAATGNGKRQEAAIGDRAWGPTVVMFLLHPVAVSPVHHMPAIQQGNDHAAGRSAHW